VETFDIEKTDNVSINRENYKGNTFLTFSYGKQLIFPATAGKYIIKPFSMVLRYNNGGFFDRDLQFESNATYVDVLPLPKGAPKDFNGGVGKFSMSTNISKKTAKVGEILTFTIKVTGKGNMHAISKPKINLPANLTLYGDPEIKEDIDYTDEGAEGEKTYKFFVKVVSGGKVEMNPFSLSYFDPSLKKYITLKEKAIALDLEGEIVASKVEVIDSISVQGGEEVLAVPVSEEKLAAKESVPHSTLWIALLGVLVVVLGAVIFFLLRKRKNEVAVSTNVVSDEPTLSGVTEVIPDSNFIIAEAQQLANQGNYKAAYGVISKSIIKKMHQKLGDTSENISKDELTERMKLDGISESIIEDYFWVIRSCQEAEYAIWDTHENWEEVVAKTKGIFRYFNL
jgi:LPXTG-motif cell wall-anchored protein